MKDIAKKFLRITIASLLALVIYTLLSALIGAVFNDLKDTWGYTFAGCVLAVFTAALFAAMYIHITYGRTGRGEDEYFSDYPAAYGGLAGDLLLLLRREIATLAIFGAVDIVCWAGRFFIEGRSPIKAALLIWAPLNLLAEPFDNNVISYIVSFLLVSALYLAGLVLMRRRAEKARA